MAPCSACLVCFYMTILVCKLDVVVVHFSDIFLRLWIFHSGDGPSFVDAITSNAGFIPISCRDSASHLFCQPNRKVIYHVLRGGPRFRFFGHAHTLVHKEGHELLRHSSGFWDVFFRMLLGCSGRFLTFGIFWCLHPFLLTLFDEFDGRGWESGVSREIAVKRIGT